MTATHFSTLSTNKQVSKVCNTSDFVEKSKEIHSNKYTYRKTVYIKSKQKVVITCPAHGDFLQKPNAHLKGNGCPDCVGIGHIKRRLSMSSFITRANDRHGIGKYDYSKTVYINSRTKVTITCHQHGDFEQMPDQHLLGRGCKHCSKESNAKNRIYSNDEFIEKAKLVHGESLYNYDCTQYKGSRDMVRIKCKEHGEFAQKAYTHLLGRGCPECGSQLTGWSRTGFRDICNKNKNGNGLLYVINCFNDNESFYKIGITSLDIKTRFRTKRRMPYQYKEVAVIIESGERIFNLERKLHRLLKTFQYQPKIPFQGESECLSTIEPILHILEKINMLY